MPTATPAGRRPKANIALAWLPRWTGNGRMDAAQDPIAKEHPVADNAFDLVILGGGSGGYACAFRAAELGMYVAMIEKDKLGGTCLHRGCIPTKALLHAAEVADQSRESRSLRRQDHLRGHRHGRGQRLQGQHRLAAVQGPAGPGARPQRHLHRGRRPAGRPDRGRGQRRPGYEGRHIVLATGSAPKSLPGLEIDGERIISSDHALTLDHVPGSVVVLGGGVIGVEFASVWRSFGAEVTIVEALPHLVPTEEESRSKLLERAFRRRGIGFELGARFAGVESTDNGVRVNSTAASSSRPSCCWSRWAAVRCPMVSASPRPASRLDRGFVKVDQ